MIRLLLQLAINRLLTTAPLTSAKLAALEGKTIRLQLQQPTSEWLFRVGVQRLEFLDRAEPVDAQIGLDLSTLIQLIGHSDKQQALKDLPVQIQGDSKVLMALADLMQQPDFEPEALLAPLLGQQLSGIIIVARQAVQAALAQQLRQGQQGLSHWLVHESQQLVTQAEFHHHQERIKELRRHLQLVHQQLTGLQS